MMGLIGFPHARKGQKGTYEMRQARAIGPSTTRCHYHVCNQITNQDMLLEDGVKDHLLCTLRRVEDFSGVRVLTFAIMTNHIHLLVCVPPREEVDDEELLRRLARIHSARRMKETQRKWTRLLALGDEGRTLVEAEKDRYRARMYDLSQFMKTFKELFTEEYNRDSEKTSKRKHLGPVFVPRFTSVYLEPNRQALLPVSSYIDFNPVKADIADRPEDYPWSGYAKAVANPPDPLARKHLLELLCDILCVPMESILRGTDPRREEQMLAFYAAALEGRVGESEERIPEDVPECPTRKAIQKKIDKKQPLTFLEHLFCRVPCYARGRVLGSKAFLGDFTQQKGWKSGYRAITGIQGVDLCSLARNRKGVFSA